MPRDSKGKHRLILALRVTLMLAMATCIACSTQPETSEGECFDAEVSAEIIQQTPTVVPECDDCIIMRWPWIVDIDVRRVHSGDVTRGPLAVLTLQHNDFVSGLGVQRWWLRRNASGGFNAVGFPDERSGGKCAPDTAPAQAFITPGTGKTIDDLRREGQKYFRITGG